MKKIKSIKDVQNFLKEIPNLNCGGCGIAALSIARWIQSNMNASCLFLFGQDYQETYVQNMKAELNRNNKPSSASHIGILVFDHNSDKQYVIDSEGTFNAFNYSYINTVSEDFLLRSINQCDEWNESFNRIYVPKIADVLDIELSDVDLRTIIEFENGVEPIFYNKQYLKDSDAEAKMRALNDISKAIDSMQSSYCFA
ncbi:MAG: hypothetical protein WC123_05055 [Bacilli bacterium]